MSLELLRPDIYEAMGYLSNSRVDLKYDVQVPPKKRVEFESLYKELTGVPPCTPGQGDYSVLGASVDKRSVQYRISYLPAGSPPAYLQSISSPASGSSSRKRVSNKELLLAMFQNGFIMSGSPPSRTRIVSRVTTAYFVHFEFGHSSAFIVGEAIEYEEFSKGFSDIDEVPLDKFSLYDEPAAKLVHSVRAGRSVAFRHHVLQAYRKQCCVCAGSLVDLSGIYETEAAHIAPKRISGSDDVRNGLALCRKHHWSFERYV